MALLKAEVTEAKTSVFEFGSITFTHITVDTNETATTPPPPKPLFIVTPNMQGSYPVVLFLHGFCLHNTFYSQLLDHLSSHGYIAVAPQLYNLIPPSGQDEVDYAAMVTNWLIKGLQPLLPQNVKPNLLKLGLAGHSRGGKAAFALALGKSKIQTSLSFSLLLGIDPVAGLSKCCQTSPKILTYKPRSFDLKIPVTVIGTGLGEVQRNMLFPPCAPNGVNHKEFFYESPPPCAHFVATDYGHMDMLNDDPDGLIGKLSSCACKNGVGTRDPMRRTVGGIGVAFFRAYLQGDSEDFKAIVDGPDNAPVKLDSVEFIES